MHPRKTGGGGAGGEVKEKLGFIWCGGGEEGETHVASGQREAWVPQGLGGDGGGGLVKCTS